MVLEPKSSRSLHVEPGVLQQEAARPAVQDCPKVSTLRPCPGLIRRPFAVEVVNSLIDAGITWNVSGFLSTRSSDRRYCSSSTCNITWFPLLSAFFKGCRDVLACLEFLPSAKCLGLKTSQRVSVRTIPPPPPPLPPLLEAARTLTFLLSVPHENGSRCVSQTLY